jgi:hypothetical protein
MEERVQKFIPTEKLMDLMEELDSNKSTTPTITLRDRAMEEVHH